MKFEYQIKSKCCGCDCEKNTRELKGLDPKRRERINFICNTCDRKPEAITKILKFNNRYLKETHSVFGFPLDNHPPIKIIIF